MTMLKEYIALKSTMGPLFVYFCDKDNTEHMVANRKITAVDVYCTDHGKSQQFIRKLWVIANTLQNREDENRREKLRKIKDFKMSRIEETLYDWPVNITELALAHKEYSLADFEKTHRKKTHNIKMKDKSYSSLTGGHCIQCLKPFNGIHLKDNDSSCRYHKGYLADDVWTCCGHNSDFDRPTFEEHLSTGCSVSIHNWRTNKKVSRRNSKASKSVDKIKNKTQTLVSMNTCNMPRYVIGRCDI